MLRPEPADLAAAYERAGQLPDGPGDRFAGYAVLGVSFPSGDVLALRRFPVTSIGRGYTSVWHCNQQGDWTFYADVPADEGCARYFGSALKEVIVAPIRVEWSGPRTLTVAVDGGRLLAWSLDLCSSPVTRIFNSISPVLAIVWRRYPGLLNLAAFSARLALRTGPLRLTGRTPNGMRFLGSPQAIWLVERSRATIGGIDVGPSDRLPRSIGLGEFLIPRRGLFATEHAFMTAAGDGQGAGTRK